MEVIGIIDTNKYKIQELEWDTNFFNVNCAKVILKKEIDKEEFKNINEYIKENKIKFVTIQNDNNNETNNKLLGSIKGVYLADVNIQFVKKVNKKQDNNIENNIRISNNLPENINILDISNSSFIYSRFLRDNHFKNGNQVYKEWAKNSFNKKDKFFCYYNIDGKTIGFILFKKDDKNTIIVELMAIEQKYRNKGIGTRLLNKLESYAVKEDIEYIKVGTQLNNIEAQNFYIKNNFKHLQNNSIYHWIK